MHSRKGVTAGSSSQSASARVSSMTPARASMIAGIVDLVRHAGGHLADRSQAFRLDQVFAQLQALGDVAADHHDFQGRPLGSLTRVNEVLTITSPPS